MTAERGTENDVDAHLMAMNMQVAMHIVDLAGPNCHLALHAWFRDCYCISDADRQEFVDRTLAERACLMRENLEQLGLRRRPGAVDDFARGSWRLTRLDDGYYTLSGIRTPSGHFISCCVHRDALEDSDAIWSRVSVAYPSLGHCVPHETEWYRIWFGVEQWTATHCDAPLLVRLQHTEITSIERRRRTGLLFDLLASCSYRERGRRHAAS